MQTSLQFVLLLVASAQAHAASANCKFDDTLLQRREFSVRLEGKKIQVIGWYHGIREIEVAATAVGSTLEKAQSRRCLEAENELDQALKAIGKAKVSEGKRVLERLRKTQKNFGFKILGLEHSSELYDSLFRDPKTKADVSTQFVPIFSRLCPKQAVKFKDLAMIYPGPEVEFVRLNKGAVRLATLGDERLSKAALAGMSLETKSFAQNVDALTAEGKRAYDKFGEEFLEGEPLDQQRIEGLIQRLDEPERSKVKRYIDEVNTSVLTGISAMNEAILKNALNQAKSITIVVGNAHVPGLRKLLGKHCERVGPPP